MQYSHLIVLKAPIKKQVNMDITVTTNGLVFVLTFSVPALRADLFIIFCVPRMFFLFAVVLFLVFYQFKILLS